MRSSEIGDCPSHPDEHVGSSVNGSNRNGKAQTELHAVFNRIWAVLVYCRRLAAIYNGIWVMLGEPQRLWFLLRGDFLESTSGQTNLDGRGSCSYYRTFCSLVQ